MVWRILNPDSKETDYYKKEIIGNKIYEIEPIIEADKAESEAK